MSKELNQHPEQAEGAQGERDAFEAWAPYRVDRYDGVYESQRTSDQWNAWQARAALAQPSDTALRRARAFVSKLEHQQCNEIKTLHRLLDAAAQPSPKPEPLLVECDACPTSGGCVEVCVKSPAQPSPAPELERPGRKLGMTALINEAKVLMAERDAAQASFKNFHRALCERFGYVHDEKDWQRDQVSLSEHIAKQVAQAGQVPDAELLSDIDKHLTDWLDLHECECENGHVCGRGHVRATRDKVRRLLAAAPQPAKGDGSDE